jgi:hypothetical protein
MGSGPVTGAVVITSPLWGLVSLLGAARPAALVQGVCGRLGGESLLCGRLEGESLPRMHLVEESLQCKRLGGESLRHGRLGREGLRRPLGTLGGRYVSAMIVLPIIIIEVYLKA